MNEQRYITQAYNYGYKAGVEHGARENVRVDPEPFLSKITRELEKKYNKLRIKHLSPPVKCNRSELIPYSLEAKIKAAIENGAEQGNLTCFNFN